MPYSRFPQLTSTASCSPRKVYLEPLNGIRQGLVGGAKRGPPLNRTILLINPPLPNFGEFPLPPLGLGYIASVLEGKGFRVRILDMPPKGLVTEKILSHLPDESIPVIGMTCVAASFVHVRKIASSLKGHWPSSMLVIGGPFASFIPEEVLRDTPEIDIVVRGEGDLTLAEIAERICSNRSLADVKGITYRSRDGRVIWNDDRPLIRNLDILPYPARHLLPMDAYRDLTEWTSIVSSRGCIYRCSFCSSSAFWQNSLRLRNPSLVVVEIEEILRRYGFAKLAFVDDLFTFGAWADSMFYEIEKRRLRFDWRCCTRIDCVSEGSLRRAASVGCREITFGIESASKAVLDRVNKKIDTRTVRQVVSWAKEAGIAVKVNFILGLPGDSIETVRETENLIKSLKADVVSLSVFTPYPGTKLLEHPDTSLPETTSWWTRPEQVEKTMMTGRNPASLLHDLRADLEEDGVVVRAGY
jgi:anaerobic magnesium-protoporphyrin IX monomethyl ester cyclase